MRPSPWSWYSGCPKRDLSGSIYELIDREYGLRPEVTIEHIEVRVAGASEASILGIAAGSPLVSITRTTRDASGVVFESPRDLFRADRTRISLRVKASPTNETVRLRGRVVELAPPQRDRRRHQVAEFPAQRAADAFGDVEGDVSNDAAIQGGVTKSASVYGAGETMRLRKPWI